MERRLRVLISAYACEPGKGSEPAVGWNIALQVQRFCDVHVVTRANNRPAIEEYERAHGKSGVTWVYYDAANWALRSKTLLGIWFYYTIWQIKIITVCRKLHAVHQFDLVHHLTFGSFLMPTFLHRIRVPLLWGPVGGALLLNRQLFGQFSNKGKAIELLRFALIRSGLVRLLQGLTIRSSARVLVVSQESRKVLGISPDNSAVFSQVGISKTDLQRLLNMPTKQTPRKSILMAGRLVPWKGISIGIKAFRACQNMHPDVTMTILGSGCDKSFLRKLAQREGVAGKVNFVGQVSRQEFFQYLESSYLLLFPSSHEPGAYVIVESMAAGKPVVCMDFGEPATLVSDGCGILVEPNLPAGIVRSFADALNYLLRYPNQAKSMGQAGRQKVRNRFIWEQKGEQMVAIYRQVVDGR